MANKLDSTSLFLAQMNQNAEILGELLGGGVGDRIDTEMLTRAIVGTNMLSQSAVLMELPEWGNALQSFRSLLDLYKDRELPWDERIAQITSEVIEKEDLLAASAGENSLAGVSDEELAALSREVSELLKYAGEADFVVEDESEAGEESIGELAGEAIGVATEEPTEEATEQAAEEATEEAAEEATGKPTEEPIEEAPEETAGETTGDPVNRTDAAPRVLDACMTELCRHTEALFDRWDSPEWIGQEASHALDETRKTLALIDFYAAASKRIIDVTNRCGEATMIDSLSPIRIALEDGARAYCEGTERDFELVCTGEENSIDARLLERVQVVLQHLIGDILLRCDGERPLRIELSIEKKNGVLLWSLGDNGDNFMTDSRLDRDECLAFYPGLRKVRNELVDLQSLLWVEPDGSGKNRFAFTTPVSLEEGRFMVWGNDGDSIAVFANQIAGIHALDEVEVIDDSRGENVTIDGRRTRVLRLGQLLAGGPEDGDRIVVIGSLETRIAFFVDGEGTSEDGIWKKEAVPTWRGMENGVVQVGERRIPLIDANELLKRYMAIVDAVAEEDVSGGVDTEVSDPSHAQAHMELDAQTPPERLNEESDDEVAAAHAGTFSRGDVDVLVVEQSNSLRSTLETILTEKTINTMVVDGLDDALAYLKAGSPKLIISDFRVPSMSAKALVDELGSEGKNIPVLVTTSHQGENADVLVERLGVAGYICKPLERDDVLSRVGTFLKSADAGGLGS